MFRPRIIPVLLLKKNGLVKSVRFKDFRYIGDPINSVKIFNDLRADELIFLDIFASNEGRVISADMVKSIGEEANMPFSVGGGISSLKDIAMLLRSGAEKVILNTIAVQNPEFVKLASDNFGSSTIVICIDVKKTAFGRQVVTIKNGTKYLNIQPDEFSKKMEHYGAGELVIQSVDLDGTMKGYDLDLIKKVSKAVSIPVIALGGAGSLDHLKQAYYDSYATGVAAGSLFIYHGPRKGVLINYPDKDTVTEMFFQE